MKILPVESKFNIGDTVFVVSHVQTTFQCDKCKSHYIPNKQTVCQMTVINVQHLYSINDFDGTSTKNGFWYYLRGPFADVQDAEIYKYEDEIFLTLAEAENFIGVESK